MNKHPEKKTVVVLGSGFAGIRLAHELSDKHFQVILVSPRNYFLFTPLLASTTVGTIEFRSIIEPIRATRKDLIYYQAECRELHPSEKSIRCVPPDGGEPFTLTYDILAIAVGADNATFNIPGVATHSCFLKDLADARAIRKQILHCFEQASVPGTSEEQKRRLLHFVVVGGGPTGVEFAAELHDFLREDLRHWYPGLVDHVRITLFEASQQLLRSFDKRLSDYTAKTFRHQKISVELNVSVKEILEGKLELSSGENVPFGLAVWSAGTQPTSLVHTLGLRKDPQGHLLTNHYLQLEGLQDVYALGDCAKIETMQLPATAQVAERQGRYLAQQLNRKARGKTISPFHHINMGMLAYIGGRKALADLPHVKGRGFLTWLFWRSIYLTKLVSIKNRILVLFDWCKAALFGRDISQF